MTPAISVSNIAWPTEDRHSFYKLLSSLQVPGVEIAITKIADWNNIDARILKEERSVIEDNGLKVSSYQSLYFGVAGAQLLSSEESFKILLDHTVKVAEIVEQLSDGGVGVFGSPRCRLRRHLTKEEAFDLGAERFSRIAEKTKQHGFTIALEPAPNEYGGDFLQTVEECGEMVSRINDPYFRIHLDMGCLEIAKEDATSLIKNLSRQIAHVHISRPHLLPVDKSAIIEISAIVGALRDVDYRGWTAIEMRESPDPSEAVKRAVNALQSAA